MTQDPMDFKTYGGVSLKALEDVIVERRKQDSQWGGPEHDDQHQVHDWLRYMAHQAKRTVDCVGTKDMDKIERNAMVKIAALAVAAVESLDRKTK